MAKKVKFDGLQHARGVLGFTKQGLPVVEYAGEPRVLAALPPRPPQLTPGTGILDWNSPQARRYLGPTRKKFLLPGQWEERDYRPLAGKILNQASTSACTGFSACKAYRIAYSLGGRSQVDYDFDPFFSYGICNNGTDQGAVIGDIIQELITVGACPEGEVPPGAMFRQQFPDSAFQAAKRFRVAKAFRCTTFEDVCSAISCGFVGAFGILIGQNFEQLDSEGVAPPPDVIRGGHALCGAGLVRLRSGEPGVLTLNSWGHGFGLDGYCVLSRHSFAPRIDAYAIEVAASLQGDDGPPVAKAKASDKAPGPSKSTKTLRATKAPRGR